MIKRDSYKGSTAKLPFYTKAWNFVKHFPQTLHRGASNPPATSGPAAAFLISSGIGAIVMMITHHFSDTSKNIENNVRTLGSWMPGSISTDPMWGNIGSYAGKETMLLIGWLTSLAILYPLLKDKQVTTRTIFFWLLSLFTLATAMAWHPLFPYLPLQ